MSRFVKENSLFYMYYMYNNNNNNKITIHACIIFFIYIWGVLLTIGKSSFIKEKWNGSTHSFFLLDFLFIQPFFGHELYFTEIFPIIKMLNDILQLQNLHIDVQNKIKYKFNFCNKMCSRYV